MSIPTVNDVRPRSINLNHLPALAKQQIGSAELTPMYLKAKAALRDLCQVDEIKEILDKHSAIAHYAKQIKDDSLRHYAERVHLRAVERIGEILAEIADKKRRREVAKSYNIGQTMADNAYGISQIPRKIRDKMIEAVPPPSVAGMARRAIGLTKNEPTRVEEFLGAKPRPRSFYAEWEEREFPKPYLTLKGTIESLEINRHAHDGGAEFRGSVSSVEGVRKLAARLMPDEAKAIREQARDLIEWLDALDQACAALEVRRD